MSTVKAGVARRLISPPPGIYLMGYGNRIQGNTGVHDDLYVTTLVLEYGDQRTALLTVDHTFINTRIVDNVKSRIHDRIAVSPDAVFVCCSHTHGGPIGYADEESPSENREYIDFLIEMLVESVVAASANLKQAHLWSGADEAGININRRETASDGQIIIGNNPDGPVDRSVQVVQARVEVDMPLATLVNYACHPVVMGPLNRQATADWVGVMRREVENSLGGLCLFFQGATGDVNPRKMRWTTDNWDEIEEQGAEVAAAVERASSNAAHLSIGTLHTSQSVCWLQLMPALGFSDSIRAFMPPEVQSDEEIRQAIRGAFPWHTEIEAREDGLYSPVYIGVMRLGDWALTALATEPFTETGLTIKSVSPAKTTFVAGYANGCNSYLPVRDAYESGGYEVETAALFYGLPAGFAPGGAETVADAIASLLR